VLEDNPRTDDSPLRHESVDSVRGHSVDVGRLSPCEAPVEATAELQDLMEDAGPDSRRVLLRRNANRRDHLGRMEGTPIRVETCLRRSPDVVVAAHEHG